MTKQGHNTSSSPQQRRCQGTLKTTPNLEFGCCRAHRRATLCVWLAQPQCRTWTCHAHPHPQGLHLDWWHCCCQQAAPHLWHVPLGKCSLKLHLALQYTDATLGVIKAQSAFRLGAQVPADAMASQPRTYFCLSTSDMPRGTALQPCCSRNTTAS